MKKLTIEDTYWVNVQYPQRSHKSPVRDKQIKHIASCTVRGLIRLPFPFHSVPSTHHHIPLRPRITYKGDQEKQTGRQHNDRRSAVAVHPSLSNTENTKKTVFQKCKRTRTERGNWGIEFGVSNAGIEQVMNQGEEEIMGPRAIKYVQLQVADCILSSRLA